jgi:repressor LexA
MVNKLRKKLTEKQEKVLKTIEDFVLAYGYSPTIRQLGELLNIANPSAVFKHILSLEKKGYLLDGGPEEGQYLLHPGGWQEHGGCLHR